MAHFKFAVSGQYLDLLTSTRGISDGLYINSFEFDFRSPEWSECQEKWVHFYNSDFNKIGPNGEAVPYDFNLVDDAITPERGVNLPAGIWEVYIHGSVLVDGNVIKRYVTETQSIQIIQSGVVNAEPLASLEPSVAEQLSAKVTQAYNERIVSATGTVDDGQGTPSVDVVITGANGSKNINFDFHNIKGKDAESGIFWCNPARDGTTYDQITEALSKGMLPCVKYSVGGGRSSIAVYKETYNYTHIFWDTPRYYGESNNSNGVMMFYESCFLGPDRWRGGFYAPYIQKCVDTNSDGNVVLRNYP